MFAQQRLDDLRGAVLFSRSSVRTVLMRRRILGAFLAFVAAIAAAALGAVQLQAAGYWNVPSNLGQRTGHGFGGGYHARWVLGPIDHDCCTWGKPTRLPCAPNPYYGCTTGGDPGRFAESPSALEGAVPTTPAAWPQPVMATAVETRATETPAAEPAPVVVTEPTLPEPEPIAVPQVQPTLEPKVGPAVEPTVQPAKPLFSPPVQR